MVKGIVFDLDGVLVDAVEWHFLALNRALSVFGYEIPREEHESLYNGLPTSVKLDLLSERNGFPRALHSFVHDLKQTYTQQIIDTSCVPNPSLTTVLDYLKSNGYVIGVASNSIRSTVEFMLDRMAIRKYFDVLLSNQDVHKPKPNPEIYKKSFDLLGLTPETALIVEDSIPGIQAARAASSNVMVVTGPKEVTLERILGSIRRIDSKGNKNEQSALSQNAIEVVIPMAGLGQRFFSVGYTKPKPMIDVSGKPMVQWVIENIRPKTKNAHFTFLCNQKHIVEYQLDAMLATLVPGCTVVPVPRVTEGAACTLLLASGEIDNDRPLVIANSDQWVELNIDDFIKDAANSKCDGSILTFEATDAKWSYAETNREGRVIRVAEKKAISPHATVGIYYFKKGASFVVGAKKMISKNIRTNGEFYVCPVYNELIESGLNIRIYEIESKRMHGLGTPEDLNAFLDWKKAA